jgi:hypothetical protein
MVLRKLLFSFVFFLSIKSFGQYVQLDQNPFSLKFYRISTKFAPLELLYPAGYDSVAQSTANALDKQWDNIGGGFPTSKHRFHVVLQNQGLVSNGFVSLSAPRSEFFTTATQDAALLGTNDWLSLLVSHEMRHVYQNNAARYGLSKWVYGLFGAYGQSVYSNLLIPNWLWEGDAVETESRLNAMGRSQIPQFKLPLNAYLSSFGVPSYAKMMGKSYRHLVPNHYVFGQYLSQQMTKDFGAEFIPALWQTTLNHPSLFAFSRQFKKRSGLSIDQYARKSFGELVSNPVKVKSRNSGFTQYLFPIVLPDGRIIAMKQGFSDIKQLVELRQGKERRLTYLGPMQDAAMLSASSDYVVWSELEYHPRWGQKQQSRLVFFDVKTGRKSYWSPHLKWISPSISEDSKYISFIHLLENGTSRLQVYHREDQNLMAELKALPGEQFLQPRLTKADQLVYISKLGGNKSVCIWDFKLKKEVYRKSFGQHNIAHPYLLGDWIYLNYPHQDVDQIARFNIKDESFELVTEASWGAYSAVPTLDSITYSAYQASGNQIVHESLKPRKINYQITSHIVKTDTSTTTYDVKYVSKLNLLNPFTWGPLVSSTGNQLEYSVQSRDVLNSLQMAVGVQYGVNEKKLTQFARLSYQAWYPIIDFTYQAGARQTQLFLDRKQPLDSLRTDQWQQSTYDIGFRIPFNLTHGAYQERLQIGSNLGLLHVQGYDLPRRLYTQPFNGSYSFLKHNLLYSKLLNRSLRDVQSRKGFVFQANWQGMPFKQSIFDELRNIQTQVFLPGLFKHDGIMLRYAYQQELVGNYRFLSTVFYPRGYAYTSFNRLSTMGVDYRFPILNTDLNLGRIVYVNRLKGNLFADFGIGKFNLDQSSQSFHSFGVDLSAQFHALRFSQGFELGVRALYLSETKAWAFVPLVIDIGF